MASDFGWSLNYRRFHCIFVSRVGLFVTFVVKDLLYGERILFICGTEPVNPNGRDRAILPSPVANHRGRIVQSTGSKEVFSIEAQKLLS